MNHRGGFDLSVVLPRIIIRRIIIRQNGTLVLFGPSLSLKNPDSNKFLGNRFLAVALLCLCLAHGAAVGASLVVDPQQTAP